MGAHCSKSSLYYLAMYLLTIPDVKYFVDSYCNVYFYDIVDLIFLI